MFDTGPPQDSLISRSDLNQGDQRLTQKDGDILVKETQLPARNSCIMASPDKSRQKPVLVIQKGKIFNPYTSIILRNALKRARQPDTQFVSSPKRVCLTPTTIQDIIKASLKYKIKIETKVKQKTDTATELISNLSTPSFSENVIEKKPDIQETEKVFLPAHPSTIMKRQKGRPFSTSLYKCEQHEGILPELKAEGLPKLGDKFESPEKFKEYAAEHAQEWFFYYTCLDSRNMEKSPKYDKRKRTEMLFGCRSSKSYTSKSKGIRKRSERPTGCPASVYLTKDRDVYMVRSVCHHHNHELSADEFSKIPHGYRLPQHIKDEIRDLLLLNVDKTMVQQYIESKMPGLSLKKSIANSCVKYKTKTSKYVMAPQRIKEMLEKIKYIKSTYAVPSENNHNTTVDPAARPMPTKKIEAAKQTGTTKKIEAPKQIGTTKKIEAPKQTRPTKKMEVHKQTGPTKKMEAPKQIGTTKKIEAPKQTGPTKKIEAPKQTGPTKKMKDPKVIRTTRVITKEALAKAKDAHVACGQELTQNVKALQNLSSDTQVNSGDKSMLNNEDANVQSEQHYHQPNKILTENLISTLEHTETGSSQGSIKTQDFQDAEQAKSLTKPCFSLKTKCSSRHADMPEHKAEGLVQIGDTFSSMEEFARYAAAHALKWFFYYHVSHSRNVKTTKSYNRMRNTWYHFSCRFNKGWYKSRSKGVRKIKEKSITCPAMLNMICEPGEDTFKVVYVCHHHSHELSHEVFSREAHGHRLTPELKTEIRNLALYKLNKDVMKRYLMDKTGLDLRPTIKNIISKVKKDKETIILSPEKEMEILLKIRDIERNYPYTGLPGNAKKILEDVSDSEEETASRVETRLNNILYDEELIQSVKDLQKVMGCDIDIDTGTQANDKAGVYVFNDEEPNHKPACDDNDSQVEVDQEVYAMDENDYIVPSADGTYQLHTQTDKKTYLEKESAPDEIIKANTEEDCEEIIKYQETNEQEIIEYQETNEEEIIEYQKTNEEEIIEYQETNEEEIIKYQETNKEEIIEYQETNEEEVIEHQETNEEESIAECDDHNHTDFCTLKETTPDVDDSNENDYTTMYEYTKGDSSNQDEIIDLTSEQEIRNRECFRDIGVQADFEIIGLEKDVEKINELESKFVSDNKTPDRTTSVCTRGQPKVILEDVIINRYNIEFYINRGSVATSLENLAKEMGCTVCDLLKKLYEGQCVFKMEWGRSGKDSRKTVKLTYVPITIAFPFEKFKYINGVQEYKSMCSKYSDIIVKLEDTVVSLSKELKYIKQTVTNIGYVENAVESMAAQLYTPNKSEIKDFIPVLRNLESLIKENSVNKQLLKKNNYELKEAKAKNEVLLRKINELELSSRFKEREILKKISNTRKKPCHKELQAKYIMTHEKIKEFETLSRENKALVEKVKELQNSMSETATSIKLYKSRERINKLENMYVRDSQFLLNKIKRLTKESGTGTELGNKYTYRNLGNHHRLHEK